MNLREMASLVRVRPPELNGTKRRLRKCVSIEDMRKAARRRLARVIYDFVEGGAEDEATVRRNRAAFEEWELVPNVMRDVSKIDLSTTVLGEPMAMPFLLGPAGLVRLVHPGGEMAVGAAAARAGIPYVLPMMATTSIEQLATIPGGMPWFNLFLWKDRGLCKELLVRARTAGYRVLVLTVDVPVSGSREKELRAGVTTPPSLQFRTVLEGAMHPSWWVNFLRSEPLRYLNVSSDIAKPKTGLERVDTNFDPSATWDDVEWVRSVWDGPVVVKGILSNSDAKTAVSVGASGIVVSNHGGKQIDAVPATIDMLPRIADTVGGETEVFLDSGIRRGSDIVKALALGARACFVVRPYFYGLGTAGDQPSRLQSRA